MWPGTAEDRARARARAKAGGGGGIGDAGGMALRRTGPELELGRTRCPVRAVQCEVLERKMDEKIVHQWDP